jgi:hypothetical protein
MFAAAAVLAALAVTLVAGWLTQPPQHSAAQESRLARCDRLAGMAVEKLAGKGIDVRTPAMRRQRETAVQACMNDFANFEWLLNSH